MRSLLLRATSARYRRERALTAGLVDQIERAGFDTVRRACEGNPAVRESSLKYLDPARWVQEAVRNADLLGLLDASPMRVLDLGAGCGYFLYVLRSRGHDVLGLDVPDEPLFGHTTELLGIPRVLHPVKRFEPLPDSDAPFHLITAFSIVFDTAWPDRPQRDPSRSPEALGADPPQDHSGPAADEVWGKEEWSFFLTDCLKRLRPGGRLFLQFNPKTNHNFDYIPDDVADMLRALPGATLAPSKETLLIERDRPRAPQTADR